MELTLKKDTAPAFRERLAATQAHLAEMRRERSKQLGELRKRLSEANDAIKGTTGADRRLMKAHRDRIETEVLRSESALEAMKSTTVDAGMSSVVIDLIDRATAARRLEAEGVKTPIDERDLPLDAEVLRRLVFSIGNRDSPIDTEPNKLALCRDADVQRQVFLHLGVLAEAPPKVAPKPNDSKSSKEAE